MKPERRFLGWQRPLLHLAAEVLLEKFTDGDMSQVLLVTPGARAGRRLLELLAGGQQPPASSPQPLFSPPRCIVMGALPESLYECSTLASDLEMLLARLHAVRTTPSDALTQLFAALPETDDTLGWLALARELEALDVELAAENKTPESVREKCVAQGLHESAVRWRALSEISQRTADALQATNRISRFAARSLALESMVLHNSENIEPLEKPFSTQTVVIPAKAGIQKTSAPTTLVTNVDCFPAFAGMTRKGVSLYRTIVLVGTADISQATCALLEASGCQVLSLVHAPPEHGAGFDDFGRLRAEYWQGQRVPLEAEELRIVEHPRDQAAEVRALIEQLEGVEPSRIVVGLGDESQGALFARAIEAGGGTARRAKGMTVAASPPARLLALLAEYSAAQRPESWAALIRHPDFQAWLTRCELTAPFGGWAAACDAYQAQHLPVALRASSPQLPGTIKGALEAVARALSGAQPTLSLGAWPREIAGVLAEIYGERKFDEHQPDQTAHARALELLGKALRAIGELGDAHPHAPQLSFPDAVRFLLTCAGEEPIPEPGGEAATELLGWLEIPLDDAPVLVLTALNEGFIPESQRAAPFLPDRLRRALGLPDNARRYARDVYFLSAIKHSHLFLRAFCCRRDAKNDPLTPSRLLFACAAEEVVRRALAFYGGAEPAHETPAFPPNTETCSLATIPRPEHRAEPVRKLSVTAFRDYLACPYRFYLKHVCDLEVAEEALLELDGRAFGILTHSVFAAFGRWVQSEHKGLPPADESAIAAFLKHRLDHSARSQFGQERLASVEIQLHQLERRLTAFARCQAEQAAEGWRIVHVEHDLCHDFLIDDESFTVYGRADRIDRHDASGRMRIWDYKSADNGHGPEKTHRAKNEEGVLWTDLQLPLYRHLAHQMGIGERAEVGYICLPKALKETRFEVAPWDNSAFAEAYAIAEAVMRKVCAQIFWPPSAELPHYDDGFAAICQDHNLARELLIAN